MSEILFTSYKKIIPTLATYVEETHIGVLRTYLKNILKHNNISAETMITKIDNAKNLNELKDIGNDIANKIKIMEGGRHREMNLKDIKELCKANQIKLSRVVDGKRVAYKKKELMTKLKRKKLL
jgi:copper homeostasis protein CutC